MTSSVTEFDAVATVFMTEPGSYEVMGILLAASLRAFSYEPTSIYTYCRAHLIDQLHPKTLEIFDELDVKLAPISPEFDAPYPQGNKLYACAEKRPERKTVLLDTDMLFLQPCLLSDTIKPGCVSGRRTSDWMWGKTVDEWKAAYASVGVEAPKHRLARQSGSYVMPTISAGFVAYDDPKFASTWLDTALQLEKNREISGIYPTLDQISLPIACYRAGFVLNLIDRKWNRAGGNLGPAAVENINAYHYQTLRKLPESPVFWLANELIADFTDFEDLPDAAQFYSDEGNWPSDVLKNPGATTSIHAPQLAVDVRHNSNESD